MVKLKIWRKFRNFQDIFIKFEYKLRMVLEIPDVEFFGPGTPQPKMKRNFRFFPQIFEIFEILYFSLKIHPKTILKM